MISGRLAALSLLLIHLQTWAEEPAPLFLSRAAWQTSIESATSRASSRGELIIAYVAPQKGAAEAAEARRLERRLLASEAFLEWGRRQTLLYLPANRSQQLYRRVRGSRPLVAVLDSRGVPLTCPVANTLAAWVDAVAAARRRLALRSDLAAGRERARAEDFTLSARFGQFVTMHQARAEAARLQLPFKDAWLRGCLAHLAIREAAKEVAATAVRSGRMAARRLARRRFQALWRDGVRPDPRLTADHYLFWQSLLASDQDGMRTAALEAIGLWDGHPAREGMMLSRNGAGEK